MCAIFYKNRLSSANLIFGGVLFILVTFFKILKKMCAPSSGILPSKKSINKQTLKLDYTSNHALPGNEIKFDFYRMENKVFHGEPT